VHESADRLSVFRPPSSRELEDLARGLGLPVTTEEAKAYATLCEGLAPSYARLDELPEPTRPVRYNRDGGSAPAASENPYGAWAWRCEIAGASGGPLAGVRVGVKDNICVAGLPMRNGSRTLEGYTPHSDATVVERILDAGGIIVGKTVCEDLCFSGGSHTSHPAPVRNPHNPRHSAGGSSSGSAAAIAAGDVTMCLGGDQGGSVRTPAAWCGCVGRTWRGCSASSPGLTAWIRGSRRVRPPIISARWMEPLKGCASASFVKASAGRKAKRSSTIACDVPWQSWPQPEQRSRPSRSRGTSTPTTSIPAS
jgi:hypothetical protein